jgi:hypothetical protein
MGVHTLEDGRFDASVDGAYWRSGELCNVHVSTQSGERLFGGVARLGTNISIVLPPILTIRGELFLEPPLDTGPCRVSFYAPKESGYASELFMARGSLDEFRRFSAVLRPPVPVSVVVAKFMSPRFTLGSFDVSTADLCSDRGARLVIERHLLEVQVMDEMERPLVDVEVRASSLNGSPPVESSATSNVEGIAQLALPPGSSEICAALGGRVPALWTVDPTGPDFEPVQRLVLSELDGKHVLGGTVLGPSHAPLSGAYVSVMPRTLTSTGWAAQATATSDASGEFQLAVPGLELVVLAAHPLHGTTPERLLSAGARSVTLVFEGQGKLRIDLTTPSLGDSVRSGPIQYWLVDRAVHSTIVDHGWQTPLLRGAIPEGDYSLFVYWAGMDAYGECAVTIAAGEQTTVEREQHTTPRVSARAFDADGPVAGATIEVLIPAWPTEVARALGRATVDDDGFFRARLGALRDFVTVRATASDGRAVEWSGHPSALDVLEFPAR